MSGQHDIAVIGLAVMGQNLILNMDDNGHNVIAYNRTDTRTKKFLEGPAKGTNIRGVFSLEELVEGLAKPRKIMLMIKSGKPVDDTIQTLLPMLDEGDIIIDGGNSNFPDTNRRVEALKAKNISFVGCGVSGGEEGARHGPSMMPGGNSAAWPHIKKIFQSISAKTDTGVPCCDWVGDGGAGHFVKMVHNGIEYGDMQLICEAYQFMKDLLQMDNDSISSVFAKWNQADLESYLIEITADILKFKENGSHVVDTILDKAGQKGTGKWTGITALDLGIPLTLIGEAVFARCLSALKDERVVASKMLNGPSVSTLPAEEWIQPLGEALYAAKIVSYTQGYMLMAEAAREYKWELNYGAIAQMWRGGCIIRSAFLDNIKEAFDKKSDLSNLLLDDFFASAVDRSQTGWRNVLAVGITQGISMPAMSSALSFYDGYRSEVMPHNLLQAQRDYFGAHTYRKLDRGDESFHTNWTGTGGDVSSSRYNV